MARKRSFDPEEAPAAFWQREDVRAVLISRNLGQLFALYLEAHPECTQTRLAVLTQHDRSDVSNLIRGIRSQRVSDIDVLTRIADGLAMPDEARLALGLAPVADSESRSSPPVASWPIRTGWYSGGEKRCARVTICGSRSVGTDDSLIDDTVRAMSTLLTQIPLEIDHGPVGVGIEIMTFIADHYRPRGLEMTVGKFGRSNVVRHADWILVIGGGVGTLDEVDLSVSMNKPMIPFPATGGTARVTYDRMQANEELHSHLAPEDFQALGGYRDAFQYARIVEKTLTGPPWS